MDWAEFNWLYFGYGVWAMIWGGFLIVAFQRRWTVAALIFGAANMALAMLTSVAPFRGVLDPNYVGFSFLLIRVPAGIGVTLVAGSMALLSLASAYLAVANRPGRHMLLITAWDSALAMIIGLPLLFQLATDPTSFSINLGEYTSIPYYIAFPIMLGLIVLPFALAAPWSYKRAMATE